MKAEIHPIGLVLPEKVREILLDEIVLLRRIGNLD